MAGILYPHNEEAYRAAAVMMDEYGSAAVVHPTGTGKSFVGFQLCRDHPSSGVCWLSPSEYIFRTQLENWRAAGGGELPNIRFFTYAKLMLLTEEELSAFDPDYIILDEFHRCGAEQWGQGVRRLRRLHPKAGVLGLSATNVRYLDNQRNMADELFDGNIASEMTLGEAITRGILDPPRYVLTVFSLQNDLKKYEARAKRARSKPVRDRAEKLLDTLRHALEQADGLDVIFERHMRERTGKYIVFCANAKHMDEMISHVPEWFGGIDREPRIYRAYSEDPATSRALARFKADDSGHLKLLFCIDMLNEGIHVEDVSGVILFRPTVSPIVYKQQIGRALSTGRAKDAVIFDVVNNVENLYSISTVEQEMHDAAACFRFCGEDRKIVNEHFQVIDEVRDCRRLFDELEDTLTASWELMYRQAKRYYEEHGDLRVPRRYKTPEGYALGSWLMTQRKVRAGRQYGRLSGERIARLDAIGMVWENRLDLLWERYLAAAESYHAQYGDLDVPAQYTSETGVALGQWIRNIRQQRASGSRCGELTPARIARLDGLGMVWDTFSFRWERNFLACSRYYLEHGDLDIPSGYVSPEGLRIGAWLARLRRMKKRGGPAAPTAEQAARLEAIGMDWRDAYDREWEKGYRHAVQYQKAHGDLAVPGAYVCRDGFPLGKWLGRHIERNGRTGIKVTPERRARLTALGMQWEERDPWQERYALAKAYYRAHGNLDIPADYVQGGVWLGKWLSEQRQILLGRRGGKALTPEQKRLLKEIGFSGMSSQERAWEEQYAQANAYFAQHGDLEVPDGFVAKNGKRLDVWVSRQRAKCRSGKISPDQRRRLEAIGLNVQEERRYEEGTEAAGCAAGW